MVATDRHIDSYDQQGAIQAPEWGITYIEEGMQW